MYGLKQAPRAWYERLDKYLQQQGFKRGSVDNNLYIKMDKESMIIIEVYVDEIIFGSDDDRLSQQFSKDMQKEFEMSLLGEMKFSWVFRSLSKTMGYLSLNPSTSRKC